MSVSHYSEIESGYKHNGKSSDIDSEDLILLLKSNHVNLGDFFDSVKDAYIVDEKEEKIEFLSRELYKTFNEANYTKAEQIRKQVQQLPYAPKSLYYSSILIAADLKDNMMTLDPMIKSKIDKYLYQSAKWVDNTEMLVIFGNSIPMFDKNTMILRMNQLIRRYKNINTFPKGVQIRISNLCINYLYDIILIRKEKDHIDGALQLLKKSAHSLIFNKKCQIQKKL